MTELRPYQRAAVNSVLSAWEAHQSVLVELPTGCGKTVMFSDIASQRSPGNGSRTGRVMIVAHREELIYQAARTLESVSGCRPVIEMADHRSDERDMWGRSQFVIASVQTLARGNRIGKFEPAEFGTLIIDEAHHDVPQCSTYRTIRQHFEKNPQLRILGVTATADRLDKLAMGQNYQSVAYQLDLPDAIDQGWLVPIQQQYVHVHGLDFSQARTTAGDLNQGDLNTILASEPEMCHKVASAIYAIAQRRKTLVFCVSVAHARITKQIFNRIPGVTAECLTGEDDPETRQRVLREFKSGETTILVGCGIFTEGFDEPSIEVVAVARPTKSRSLYTQMVGRGTRTLTGILTPDMNVQTPEYRRSAIAASGKPHLTVIDLVGNSGKHKLISTVDILAGRYPPAARAKAVEENLAGRGTGDMRADAAKADREEAERLRREAEQRAAELREAERRTEMWRKGLYGNAQYTTRRVDPFGESVDHTPERIVPRGNLPSENQVKFLLREGYDPAGMSQKDAGKLIGEIKAGWNGEASPRQKTTLGKFGETGSISAEKAAALFQVLKARNWSKRDYQFTRGRLAMRVMTDGRFAPVVKDPAFGSVILHENQQPTIERCREFLEKICEIG